MVARRLGLGMLVGVFVLVGVLALSVVSARAALTRKYLSQITEVPASSSVSSPGPFKSVHALTVDGGELYVADRPGLVDRFDASSCAFLSQFPLVSAPSHLYQGIAVGHLTGESQVYVGGDEESLGGGQEG